MSRIICLVLALVTISIPATAQLRVQSNNNIVMGSTTLTTSAKQMLYNDVRQITLEILNERTNPGPYFGINTKMRGGAYRKYGIFNDVKQPDEDCVYSGSGHNIPLSIGFGNQIQTACGAAVGMELVIRDVGENAPIDQATYGTYTWINAGDPTSGTAWYHEEDIVGNYTLVNGRRTRGQIWGMQYIVQPFEGDSSNYGGYFYLDANGIPNNSSHTAPQYALYAGIGNLKSNHTGYAAYLDGNVVVNGTITELSDEREKENIRDVTEAMGKIKQLRAKQYNMKNTNNRGKDKDREHFGFLAQDLEASLPEVVYNVQQPGAPISSPGVDEEGLVIYPSGNLTEPSTTHKAVDYNSIIALLVKGMQEQEERIAELENELNKLKARNE